MLLWVFFVMGGGERERERKVANNGKRGGVGGCVERE